MKAIFVFDMPKYCSDCKLYVSQDDFCIEQGKVLGDDFCCFLKPMPKKRTDNTFNGDYDFGLAKENDGWNACIDELQKEYWETERKK